jgi:hypothetical protein
MANEITTPETFLNANEMREKFFRDDVNSILTMITNRFLQSRRNPIIRMLQAELQAYPVDVVQYVKSLLNTRGYVLTDIEDNNNNVLGFKISLP